MQFNNIQISKEVLVAIIGGVCVVLAAIIGVSFNFSDAKKENSSLKKQLKQKTEDLKIKSDEISTFKINIEDCKNKLKTETTNSLQYMNKLNALTDVIIALNKTTLVVNYNSNAGWSGFEHMHGKGEYSLQCSVDRFFVEWNKQVRKMINSGCSGVKTKIVGIHHQKDCP